jgi:hypothetical protein
MATYFRSSTASKPAWSDWDIARLTRSFAHERNFDFRILLTRNSLCCSLPIAVYAIKRYAITTKKIGDVLSSQVREFHDGARTTLETFCVPYGNNNGKSAPFLPYDIQCLSEFPSFFGSKG